MPSEIDLQPRAGNSASSIVRDRGDLLDLHTYTRVLGSSETGFKA